MNGARFRSAVAIAALLVAPSCAQADRYELGVRLRAFERALDAETDPAHRQAAFRCMEAAVQAFFRIDVAAVARAIDAAQDALAGATPDAATRFARSLQVALAARLVDRGAADVAFRVESVYRVDDDLPDGLVLEFRSADGTLLASEPIESVPHRGSLPLLALPCGDHVLSCRLRRGDATLATREHGISIADDLAARITALGDEVDGKSTLERATFAMLLRDLRTMTRARREETVWPGTALLAEAEALARAIRADRRHHGSERPGEHRLVLPTAAGRCTVRIAVPAVAADAPPPPLVLALHGAGGSENLFFDGYGCGLAPRLAATRNWLFVAPRLSPLAPQSLPALLDALAARYRFDPARVLVLGHSMGAMQATAEVTAAPDRFRALAALGGGGNVHKGADLAHLACFVGAGSRDFGRRGAEALHARLVTAAAASTFHLYDDVEHLTVVQVALPEVFAFFDAAAK